MRLMAGSSSSVRESGHVPHVCSHTPARAVLIPVSGQKRGCAQICPDGEMRTVRGRRLIMGDTEDVGRSLNGADGAAVPTCPDAGDGPS